MRDFPGRSAPVEKNFEYQLYKLPVRPFRKLHILPCSLRFRTPVDFDDGVDKVSIAGFIPSEPFIDLFSRNGTQEGILIQDLHGLGKYVSVLGRTRTASECKRVSRGCNLMQNAGQRFVL